MAQDRAVQVPASAGPEHGKLLLTIDEAARRLGIGRTLMYRLVSTGAVQSVTVGRLRRVPSECLGEYVATLKADQAKGALTSILSLAEQSLARGDLDYVSLADLEMAVARLRSAIPDRDDHHRVEGSAA